MTHVVVAQTAGQLGNQLFLFAHLIAFAEELNLEIHNTAFNEHRLHFYGTAQNLYARYPAGKRSPSTSALSVMAQIGGGRGMDLSSRLIRRVLPQRNPIINSISCAGHMPKDDVDLADTHHQAILRSAPVALLFGGRYRNYELFSQHESKIREFLRFCNTLSSEQFMEPLREKYDFIVSLHIRQGDYARFLDGKYYFDTSEYLAAAELILGKIDAKRPLIVICSNAPQHVSEACSFEWVSGPGSVIGDMQILAMSDLIIAVPSTFSRWASFIGRVPICYIDKDGIVSRLAHGELPPPASH
ncbi:MAG: alpha-1,2-fucosyltransferase [Pseudomonadota bacterium]